MSKTAIPFLMILSCLSTGLIAQDTSRTRTKTQKPVTQSTNAHKNLSKGRTVSLSADTIYITISDSAPHFVIENVKKSLDAKNLALFLNAFYESSKARRSNDILIRSQTKREVPGETKVRKLMEALSRKHEINVVYFPPPTGFDPSAEIREFARRHLK